jgi:hypothetical protein
MYNSELAQDMASDSESSLLKRKLKINVEHVDGLEPRHPSTSSLGTRSSTPPVNKTELKLHQIRCLEALSKWSQLNNACQTLMFADDNLTPGQGNSAQRDILNATLNEVTKRQKLAQMAARGCWAVG